MKLWMVFITVGVLLLMWGLFDCPSWLFRLVIGYGFIKVAQDFASVEETPKQPKPKETTP